MSGLNICLVSREYPTDNRSGGIGTYTEKAARGLAGLGASVWVLTETHGAPFVRREGDVEIRGLTTPRVPGLGTLARAQAVAAEVGRLPRVPDIVQASEYRAEGFWLSLRRHPKTKLVTRLATPSFLLYDLNRNGRSAALRIRHRYVDWTERTQTRRSDAVFSLSDALADVISQRWGIRRGSMPTIPNGVDFADQFAPVAAELPAELRGKDYIIYFGRLEERKGVHILAQALPDVLARHENLHVVFAGNTVLTYEGQTMDDYVRRRCEPYFDRLHFFPRLPPRELYPLLRDSLFAVLPSLWEALGNVSLEALDLGKPVVATSGSGFSEVVEDGRSGLLVEPGNVDALRAAMLTLLGDRALLAQMSSAAKARAEHFALGAVTARLLDFYTGLVQTPAAPRTAVRPSTSPTR